MRGIKWHQITPITWRRILITILIIGLASVIRLLFFSDLGRGIPYLTYYPAVMIAAIFGGIFSGLFGTAISAFLCFYWVQKGFMSPVEMLAFMVFILSCIMISLIAEAMRMARMQAREAQEHAESANKAKSVFLANMSHELRTPLNAILGYSQLMQREHDLRTELREYLKIINRSGEHLLSLINDVLEIAKIEAGRVILNQVTFKISVLVEDIRKMFWEKTEVKGLHFEILGVDTLPCFVVADETKLRIVLINLLSNAVKFTQKGGITVRFSVQKRPLRELFLHVEVEDTGVGIDPSEMNKLFNYFVQTESGHKSQSGTGLGLAISKDYIKMMGGEISAKSRLGEGTTFMFTIKIEEGKEAGLQVLTPVKRVINLKPGSKIPHVLVAEDTEESRNLLVSLLREAGFEVRSAVNGKEAVDIFKVWLPDFIWMDIRMPVMDGKEAAKIIKSSENGKLTKIAALSAHVLGEERDEIIEAGCDDFVGKPYRESDLFEVMAKHLDLHYIYDEDQNEAPSKNLDSIKNLDLSSLDAVFLAELSNAVNNTNAIKIAALAKDLTLKEPEIATALLSCANNFDYESIQTAINRVFNKK